MDKLPWRSTGGRKGPFTVDSGGTGARGKERPITATATATGTGARHSNPPTPLASPATRHGFGPQSYGIPVPGRQSREGSMYPDSTPTPVTPIDGGSGSRHSFTPVAYSGFNASYNAKYNSLSTTPIEPPPSPWGTPAFDFSKVPTPMPWMAQSELQPDVIDPNIFSNLADLIESGQASDTPASFNFATSQHHTPTFTAPMNPSPPTTFAPTSLLTRRIQEQQSQAFQPQTFQGLGNIPQPPHTTPTPAALLAQATALNMPTPPQSFSSSFGTSNGMQSKSHWPMDRTMMYNETPVTTPGGSDQGFGSPADVSSGVNSPLITRASPDPRGYQ
jgi:hypothetical protein